MLLLLQGGYVELMNGPSLFDSMYDEDAEGKKLNEMPGVDELLIVYPFGLQYVWFSVKYYVSHYVNFNAIGYIHGHC